MMGHAIPGLLSSVSQKFLHPHLTYLMQFCSKKATFYSHWPDQQGLFLNYPRNKDVLFTKLDVSMKVSGQLGQKSRIGWSTFHRLDWLHFGQNWQDWVTVWCWVVKDKESFFHTCSRHHVGLQWGQYSFPIFPPPPPPMKIVARFYFISFTKERQRCSKPKIWGQTARVKTGRSLPLCLVWLPRSLQQSRSDRSYKVKYYRASQLIHVVRWTDWAGELCVNWKVHNSSEGQPWCGFSLLEACGHPSQLDLLT